MSDEPKPKRSKFRPATTWKKVEQAILRFWGVGRRGAYVRGDRGGKPDSPDELKGWSIEIKHRKRPHWADIIDAVAQAETNALDPNDIPVAVIHGERMQYKDSLVVMRLEKFSEFFINMPKEEECQTE